MTMKFMSILLTEGRKEDLKKKYAKKFEGGTGLDFILNISDLIDFNHKYTDWVLKNVNPESENFDDDVEYIVELIKDFNKYSSQFPKKDINQYVSVNELDTVINHVRTKNKDKELEGQVEKIYEDDKFLVIIPKTEQSSCKYGAGTRWCTTSRGTGHFGRYTSGNQALFYIIDKSASKPGDYTKVAAHFNESGDESWWDTKDNRMSEREVSIFKYAFPEVVEPILKYLDSQFSNKLNKSIIQVFDNMGETSEEKKFIRDGVKLEVSLRGFQNIPDLGYGHSQGIVSIFLIIGDKSDLIDSYDMFITYSESIKSKEMRSWGFKIDVGFQGIDPTEDQEYIDLNLEQFDLKTSIILRDVPNTAEGVRQWIASRVILQVQNNAELQKKVSGGNLLWRPDRANYGYTFKSKDKGLIKKLTDWLDKGSIGTKLDFLTDIGKLEKKMENGKPLYSSPKRNNFEPSKRWRGQFSSFFASAKNAGILDYRKVGQDYLLKKGPNFDAFKEGKLKAL